MKVRYFQDTDTLYIEFRPAKVSETRDLDENTLLWTRKGIFAGSRSNMRRTGPAPRTSLSKKSPRNLRRALAAV